MSLFAAQIISFIFYPYVVIPSGLFFIFLKITNNFYTTVIFTLIIVLSMVTIFAFEILGLKLGMFSNFDITNRKQRTNFYLFVLLLLSAGITTLFLLNISSDVLAVSVGVFIGVSLMLVVNKKIKASIHIASISALLLTISVLYGYIYYSLLLLIPLVAWSRVKTKKHKIGETVAGAITGLIITVLSLAMIQYF